MDKIKVSVLDYDGIENAFMGLRICTDTLDKINSENYDKNIELLMRSLRDEVPHLSILKHIIYHILIEGIPRSLLQELVRHQVGVAVNVLSTRWALHKIFKNPIIDSSINNQTPDFNSIEAFITEHYFISKELLDMRNSSAMRQNYEKWITDRFNELVEMKRLREKEGFGNDKLKHLINESLRTKVFMTISSLAMRNLLNQRLYKDSWYVFRHLAALMYKAIPEDHRIIYRDIIEARGLPEF